MAESLKFSIDPSVIFQLGESLISDSIQALLELVKNSFDADASYAKVTIHTTGKIDINGLQFSTENGVIIIEDDGFGMDENDIEKGWLRISSRRKLELKKDKKTTPGGRTPLGDKGLGRLGTQRLGHNLEIFTTKQDSDYEYQYSFSWDDFNNVDAIQDVRVYRNKISSKKKKGTKIVISNLIDRSIWEETGAKKLEQELSKLISPYEEIREFEVYLTVNGKKIELANISEKIRDIAQIHYKIDFDGNILTITGQARLDFFRGTKKEDYALYAEPDNGKEFYEYLIEDKKSKVYKIKKARKKKWFVEYSKKIELDNIPEPEKFEENKQVKIYNPGKFSGQIDNFDLSSEASNIQNIFNQTSEFRKSIKSFSGIKIYRNGFGIRIDHDWLKFGEQQTSAGSYYGLKPKNTSGYIALTAKENMDLQETTNREGFQKTPYFINFIKLMEEFKNFSGDVQEHLRRTWNDYCKKKNEGRIDPNLAKNVKAISDEIQTRIQESETQKKSLEDIKSRLKTENKAVQKVHEKLSNSDKITVDFKKKIEETLNDITQVLQSSTEKISETQEYLSRIEHIKDLEQVVSDRVDSLQEQIHDFIETTALGLTAEAISHEIFNSTDLLLERTDSIRTYLHKQKDYDINISSFIEYIKATISALRKQISYLSPALRYVRDKKEGIKLEEFIIELEEHYRTRLEERGISIKIEKIQINLFDIKMNKGKLLQIFNNFILNSEYWLKEDIRMKRLNKGEARITIEVDDPFVRISDNGRGIEKSIETIIFEPFITTKPKQIGHGLGLFIIKQFLDSEGCSVDLMQQRNTYGRLFKFQIDFRGALYE